MYRCSASSQVCYTPEDLNLFRESPFASWMERLTLENPGHGIAPDVSVEAVSTGEDPHGDIVRSFISRDGEVEPLAWAEFTATTKQDWAKTSPKKDKKKENPADIFGVVGKDVTLIEEQWEESQRRSATLQAIQGGVSFIVNARLAVGPLVCVVNLLVRSRGASELGDYFYMPCSMAIASGREPAFELCFAADLLHSLQGVLPPQMLILREGADFVALHTQEHIHHFRAVKQRFMTAQDTFRKHCMPDPAESSQFGRWSRCARDVLKQRALAMECEARPAEQANESSTQERQEHEEAHYSSDASKTEAVSVLDTAGITSASDGHARSRDLRGDVRRRSLVTTRENYPGSSSLKEDSGSMIDRDTLEPIPAPTFAPRSSSPGPVGTGEATAVGSGVNGSEGDTEQPRINAFNSSLRTSTRSGQ